MTSSTDSTDSTDSTESDPGARNLEEEPQQERGEAGSRDADTEGSTDRPVGSSDADDQTGIDPQDPDTGSPTMQSGDGG